MVGGHVIEQIGQYLYEIPSSFREDMRVPARLYADADLLEHALDDESVDQLINTATLPGVVKYVLAMPDIHQGYGSPIGGVVATQLPDGVISPGGVGYDINCGVRLLGTHLREEELQPYLDDLATAIYNRCPSGVGKGGEIRLKSGELERVLEEGSRWAKTRGFANDADLERTEEEGCMEGADAAAVSARARERGRDQVGTLGAGNHFIEVDLVQEVLDDTAAARYGLRAGQVAVQVHCGSRGLGHQVCSDYVNRFQRTVQQYGIRLPDRELVCAPLSSPDGQAYLAAMKASANYAYANRQVLVHHIRQAFEDALAGRVKNPTLYQVYDVGHNMAKIEEHEIDGSRVRVCVHRKGATRAFGPGRADIPSAYRDVGQPVLVPGSMGTASWVLRGSDEAMRQTFGSACHGAGRAMSRSKAKKTVQGGELRERLEGQGIRVRAGSLAGLAEEAPSAYKDVDRVVQVMHGSGIASPVARLTPIAVIKG